MRARAVSSPITAPCAACPTWPAALARCWPGYSAGAGPIMVPELATVAAAGVDGMRRGSVTFAPLFGMPLSFAPGVDTEEVREVVREELIEAQDRAEAGLRRLLHDD